MRLAGTGNVLLNSFFEENNYEGKVSFDWEKVFSSSSNPLCDTRVIDKLPIH